MSSITISLFGPLEVAGPDGAPIAVSGPKLCGLLAYLALNGDMMPTRDRLAALLWADRFSDQARQSLRQCLLKLRRLLTVEGAEAIVAEGDRIGLCPDRVETDVERFMALVAANRPEADLEATRLYRGELLENLFVRDAGFQDWLLSERQRMATIACPAFERGVDHLLQGGRSEEAMALARRLIGLDPLREASHRLMMRVLAQGGQRAAAVQQYKACAALLAEDLQVDPAPETQRLLDEIRQVGFARPTAAVREGGPGGEPQRTRLAVLPVASPQGRAEDRLRAEVVGEDVTEALSKYRWLEIAAAPACIAEGLDSREFGRLAGEEGLDYAVASTLRLLGDRLRLTVQLVGLAHGRYIWVHRYERDPSCHGEALDELARTVAASVEAELVATEGSEARRREESELTAWDCCHRGLSIQYEFTDETNRAAQRLFRRAVALDPGFAEARARLSYALVLSAVYFGADHRSGLLDEALALAEQACRRDPRDAVCRFALGRVHLARSEYERSIGEIEAAIALNPSMAQAHCALGDSLTYAGRFDEAMPSFDEAVRLSPNDPYRWAFLSYGAAALLFKGDYGRSAEWSAEAVQEPNCHFWAKALRAAALGHLGRREAAAGALAELRRARPGISCAYVRDRLFYLRDRSQVETYLAGLRAAGLD